MQGPKTNGQQQGSELPYDITSFQEVFTKGFNVAKGLLEKGINVIGVKSKDDLDEMDMVEIRSKYKNNGSQNVEHRISHSSIHKYLDGGFSKITTAL